MRMYVFYSPDCVEISTYPVSISSICWISILYSLISMGTDNHKKKKKKRARDPNPRSHNGPAHPIVVQWSNGLHDGTPSRFLAPHLRNQRSEKWCSKRLPLEKWIQIPFFKQSLSTSSIIPPPAQARPSFSATVTKMRNLRFWGGKMERGGGGIGRGKEHSLGLIIWSIHLSVTYKRIRYKISRIYGWMVESSVTRAGGWDWGLEKKKK